MRLIFSILWFDDSEEYFDSLDDSILLDDIRNWGFEPKIEKVTTPQQFMSYSPFTYFDLIVVDRNLESSRNGQDFISTIRDNAVYTEIIFYTAGNASDLWEAIKDKQLEGIYVSTRRDVIPKISKVGKQSVQKILDLENMRGIVMAEVGELDHLLDTIITIGMESLPEDQRRRIFEKFRDSIKEQYAGNSAKLDSFWHSPDSTQMLMLCDSNKRWENLNRLWKSHEILKGKNRIGDYVKDILTPRNFLAHGKSVRQQDGSYLFMFQQKEFHFSEDSSLALRKNILKYKNELLNLIQLLKDIKGGI